MAQGRLAGARGRRGLSDMAPFGLAVLRRRRGGGLGRVSTAPRGVRGAAGHACSGLDGHGGARSALPAPAARVRRECWSLGVLPPGAGGPLECHAGLAGVLGACLAFLAGRLRRIQLWRQHPRAQGRLHRGGRAHHRPAKPLPAARGAPGGQPGMRGAGRRGGGLWGRRGDRRPGAGLRSCGRFRFRDGLHGARDVGCALELRRGADQGGARLG
mmetsp:Transcript_23885/g.69119  ORF Transcript_23885/g.69119 Transcript_23885/m.69119 type:complete len:214 (-) Transcript_23885:82-723(-)